MLLGFSPHGPRTSKNASKLGNIYFMHRDRRCIECGGLEEFLYEMNWKPVYYCATCDRETTASGSELVGPDVRFEEEAGE
tara:strand:+ start:174 stop:413 length:240 start_codon:yes stop_codon:yes gene_type:complete